MPALALAERPDHLRPWSPPGASYIQYPATWSLFDQGEYAEDVAERLSLPLEDVMISKHEWHFRAARWR